MKKYFFILVLVTFFGTCFAQSDSLRIDTVWFYQDNYSYSYSNPIFSKTRMDSLDAIRDSLNSLLENLQIQEDSLELSKDSLFHVWLHSSGRKSRKAHMQYDTVQERYDSLREYKWTVKKILDQHNGGSSHQSDKVPEGWYVRYEWYRDTTYYYSKKYVCKYVCKTVLVSLDDTAKSFVVNREINGGGIYTKYSINRVCDFFKENGPFVFRVQNTVCYYEFFGFENGRFTFKEIGSNHVKEFALKDHVFGLNRWNEHDIRDFLPKKKYVTLCKKYGKRWTNFIFEGTIPIGLPVEILRIIRPDLGYVSYSTDFSILQTSSGSLTVGVMDGKVQSVTYL